MFRKKGAKNMPKIKAGSNGANMQKAFAPFVNNFTRRIEATPPSMCAVAFTLNLLQASGCQTCGKCVPCARGIGNLEAMLKGLLNFQAPPNAVDEIRKHALVIKDTADCAIGWHTAQVLLDALDAFADEFEAHATRHQCGEGVGQTLPCETLCPAHVDVPAYIGYIREGDCASAIKTIRKDNPFPTACAYVCEHPCETRCRRQIVDSAINIRGLKKYACNKVSASKVETPAPAQETGKKVAIVGSGPAGMTCAYYCALFGHETHIFEARKQPGGMMRYGIPEYRFPREALNEDIRAILGVGNIFMHLETNVDAAKMQELASEYDAVYVAIGAQAGKTLALEGTSAKGVMSAVDMLGEIGDGNYPNFSGKNVVVVGGGNVAMDCARTSIRAGAKNVTVAYRRRIEDMTALREEIDAAMQEGVEILELQAPHHVEVEGESAVALYTQPQIIGPVKRGRPAPRNAQAPLRKIDADVVLIAVGQAIESAPFEEAGMQADRTYFETDEFLKSKGKFENVFVGGDCQTGPKTVIAAIAAGRMAAANIDAHLGFSHKPPNEPAAPAARQNWRQACGRVNVACREARQRKSDFRAVELEMSDEEAMQEASRCLRCDHFGCATLNGGRERYEL